MTRGVTPGADDPRSASSFLRGLTLGAILGAIIAGSSLWSRRRRDRGRLPKVSA